MRITVIGALVIAAVIVGAVVILRYFASQNNSGQGTSRL